jgi:hypothetical protein
MKIPRPFNYFLIGGIILISILLLKGDGCLAIEKKDNLASSTSLADSPSTNTFKPEESIRFGVYSNGIKVGSGTLAYHGQKILGQEKIQYVELLVSSLTINDREVVFGENDFSSPIKVERHINLFGRNELIYEDYEKDKKSVLISKRVNNSSFLTQRIQSQEKLSNVLLSIYKLRNDPDLKVGNSYRIVLPTQVFDFIVRDQRNLHVPLGSFKAFYIESNPPKYKIWLNNDKEKTPLRLQGFVGAGLVYLAAIEVTNS